MQISKFTLIPPEINPGDLWPALETVIPSETIEQAIVDIALFPAGALKNSWLSFGTDTGKRGWGDTGNDFKSPRRRVTASPRQSQPATNRF